MESKVNNEDTIMDSTNKVPAMTSTKEVPTLNILKYDSNRKLYNRDQAVYTNIEKIAKALMDNPHVNLKIEDQDKKDISKDVVYACLKYKLADESLTTEMLLELFKA
jgi:polyhydroxyalkanoate synthesis regulator protein